MNRTRQIASFFAFSLFLSSAAHAASPNADDFLAFPMAQSVAAAKATAVTWLVRQGADTIVFAAKGPEYRRVEIARRSDVRGDPIVAAAISPDGKTVAYLTGVPKGEGAFNPASLIKPPKTEIWIASADGSAKPVAIGGGSDFRFSDDSRWLYVSRGDDLLKVPVAKPHTKADVLAPGGGAWSQYQWLPDGDAIFLENRRGYAFLGRYHPGAEAIDWLVTGPDRLAAPVLSPDKTKVAMLRLGGRRHSTTPDQLESEAFAIDVLDLATGTVRTIWKTKGPALTLWMDDPEQALRWSDDNTLVFYSEDDNWGRLYAIPASGGTPHALTPSGCMVAHSEGWDETIFAIHNCRDRDTRQASLIDVPSGRETPVETGDLVLSEASAGNGFAAFTGARPDQAAQLRIIDLKTGRLLKSESYADYSYRSPLTSAPPREVHLTAADGLEFTGQLFTPSTPGPHPGLVYVHGGPPRQMFPAFHYGGYYANDYAINRRLAEQGYEVLAINYRSGIGYGRTFRDAPGRAWREASEYRDVLAAGRWLAAQPGVDAQKIGIWGGSYGGLLTGQALSRNSDLFKAGVGIHGVYDWGWPSPLPGHLNPSGTFGVAEKDRERATANSPVGHLDTWRSPILMIHGDDDMNVDVVETVDLASRLRERGIDARVLILPGEPHDFIRHSSWERTWRALDSFFLERLPPTAG